MKSKLLALLIVPVLAAACSSGDATAPAPSDPNLAGTDIQGSAIQTSDGASVFVKRIVLAGDKDTEDTVVDGNAALASSETDEPDASV